MRIIGFNFTKINIEKFPNPLEKFKVNTGIDILNIHPIKSSFLRAKGDIFDISFKYVISYEPEIAKIEFAGNLALEIESKTSKELVKQWKEKKIPEDFKFTLFNIILRKSNVRALQLEDELNLPYHMPFPTLRKEEKKE